MKQLVGFTLSIFTIVLLVVGMSAMHTHAAKIVGLVPVRNEALLIEQCLRGLSKYTDAIIVLDDASEDTTVEIIRSIAQECNVVKLIVKNKWMRTESADRNTLLEAGRAIGGTHFIVLDADELFTATCMQNNTLRDAILALKPGQTLFMHWIRLWKDIYTFKASNIELKKFIFCDNGTASYPPRYIHSYRTPEGLEGESIDFGRYDTHGVLHFQAVNWRNMRIRQAWYQCLERINKPLADPTRIAYLYDTTIDEADMLLARSPKHWFEYDFFDADAYYKEDTWREAMIAQWMQHYGKDYFKDLSIWDIDWRAKNLATT